jgi:GTP-binding protein
VQDYKVLRNELKSYNPELLKRPCLVVLTKMDLPATDNDDAIAMTNKLELPILKISALTGEGLDELKNRLWELIKNVPR